MDMNINCRLLRLTLALCAISSTLAAKVKYQATTHFMSDPRLVDCYGNPGLGGMDVDSAKPTMTINVDPLISRVCYMEFKANSAGVKADNTKLLYAGFVNAGVDGVNVENLMGAGGGNDSEGIKGFCAQAFASKGDALAVASGKRVVLGQAKAADKQDIKNGMCSVVSRVKADGSAVEEATGVGGVLIQTRAGGKPAGAEYFGVSFSFPELFAAVKAHKAGGSTFTTNQFGEGLMGTDAKTANHTLIFGDETTDGKTTGKEIILVAPKSNKAGNSAYSLDQGGTDFEAEFKHAASRVVRFNIALMKDISSALSTWKLATVPVKPPANGSKVALTLGAQAEMAALELRASGGSNINFLGGAHKVVTVQVLTAKKTSTEPHFIQTGTEFLTADLDNPGRETRNIYVHLPGKDDDNILPLGDAGLERDGMKIFFCAWPLYGCMTESTMVWAAAANATGKLYVNNEASEQKLMRIGNGWDQQYAEHVWQIQTPSTVLSPTSGSASHVYQNSNDVYVYHPKKFLTDTLNDVLIAPSHFGNTNDGSATVSPAIPTAFDKLYTNSAAVTHDDFGEARNPFFGTWKQKLFPSLGHSTVDMSKLGISINTSVTENISDHYYNQGRRSDGSLLTPHARANVYYNYLVQAKTYTGDQAMAVKGQTQFRWSPVYSVPLSHKSQTTQQAKDWYRIPAGAINTRTMGLIANGTKFANTCMPYRVYSLGGVLAGGDVGLHVKHPSHQVIYAGCQAAATAAENYITNVAMHNDSTKTTNVALLDDTTTWMKKDDMKTNEGIGEYGEPGYVEGEQAYMKHERMAIAFQKVLSDGTTPAFLEVHRKNTTAKMGTQCKTDDYSKTMGVYNLLDTTAGADNKVLKGLKDVSMIGADGKCAGVKRNDTDKCSLLYETTKGLSKNADLKRFIPGEYGSAWFDTNKLRKQSSDYGSFIISDRPTAKDTVIKCAKNASATTTSHKEDWAPTGTTWFNSISLKTKDKETQIYDWMIAPNAAQIMKAYNVTLPGGIAYKMPKVLEKEDLLMMEAGPFSANANDINNQTPNNHQLISRYCSNTTANTTNTEISAGGSVTNMEVKNINLTQCFRIFGPSSGLKGTGGAADAAVTDYEGKALWNTYYPLYVRRKGSKDARWHLQWDPSSTSTGCEGFKVNGLTRSSANVTKASDITAWKLANKTQDLTGANDGGARFLPLSNWVKNEQKFLASGTTITKLGDATDSVKLLIRNGLSGDMEKDKHYCYIQVHECTSIQDQTSSTCTSWRKMMPDPIGQDLFGRQEAEFPCVSKTISGSTYSKWVDEGVPLNKAGGLYGIGFNYMDFMVEGYKFSLWHRRSTDHVWFKNGTDITFLGAGSSLNGSTGLTMATKEQSATIEGTAAILYANVKGTNLTYCLVPTGSDAFAGFRTKMCDTSDRAATDKSVAGLSLPTDNKVRVHAAKRVNNGLTNTSVIGSTGATKLYPGTYDVYSRDGNKRLFKESGQIRIKWKTYDTNVFSREDYPGICVKDCYATTTTVYQTAVTTENVSTSEPGENSYSKAGGNGKTYLVADAQTAKIYYTAYVWFSEAMDTKLKHWIYFSTDATCDCSASQCDKNAGTNSAHNLFDPLAIKGDGTGEKLTFYGDAGCQLKKQARKFYFPVGGNTKYYMCVQQDDGAGKGWSYKGRPVYSAKNTYVTLSVEKKTIATPPTGSKSTSTTPISPSAMTKLSGLTTIVLALMGIFFM